MTGLFLLDLDSLRGPRPVDMGVTPTEWRVCPRCLWLRPMTHWQIACYRPAHELVRYGHPGGKLIGSCNAETVSIPRALNDALWSALALGGVNAVVAVAGALTPEQVGLPSAVAKWRSYRDHP